MGRFLTETSIPNYAKTSRIIYDTEGEAQGIELSASSDTECNSSGIFLYRKNLQGDITGLINTEGNLLCEFTYDAYGNIGLHTESTLGSLFSGILSILFIPQLYRGYVYTVVGDEMCYYLGSRFYSPKLGRFLNADIHADTGTGVVGTNMFAHCNNNPVMMIDPNGTWGEDVHSGINNKSKIQYNGKRYNYGTYYWANKEVGINASNAKIIAKSCLLVDTVFSPVLLWHQDWHFNTFKYGGDSRNVLSLMCITLALSCFETAKNNILENSNMIFEGLIYLGAALHPIQDKYAHTQEYSKKFLFIHYHSMFKNVDNAFAHASVIYNQVRTETIKILSQVCNTYGYFINNYIFIMSDKLMTEKIKAVLKQIK